MTRRAMAGRITAVEQQTADQDAQLVERLGVVMADLLRGVLADLDLSAEQQRVAAEAVPRHLRLMREALNTGGTT